MLFWVTPKGNGDAVGKGLRARNRFSGPCCQAEEAIHSILPVDSPFISALAHLQHFNMDETYD
jgi:hypothetical protein